LKVQLCIKLFTEPLYISPVIANPCIPSPCGHYAECRNNDGFPSCSCQAPYIGNPPNCRPECSIHSDCLSNQTCINQKCQDPCPGSCGFNAECKVINHIPTCFCSVDFTGDPFVSCNYKPFYRKLKYKLFFLK
jgi:hypothetical protein